MSDPSAPETQPVPSGPSYEPKVPPAPAATLKKVRVRHIREMKQLGRPVVMATAYDAPMAALADEGGMDMLLVGDSVGMVVHGMDTTLPVTMEMMILHTQAVVRGSKRCLIVTDLPFMSYQVDPLEAVRNAGRLVKEGGAEAVKLESHNALTLETIARIREAGIPVMGHIGLVPQSIHMLGGYRVQGRGDEEGERLIMLAEGVEKAGAFSVVLEGIPAPLAKRITDHLHIPTVGIGAGAGCDGQVLVSHDLLGYTTHPPKFVKQYVDLHAASVRAFRKYGRDVRERLFPDAEHQYD
ncbi:MAG: 3-methyl-2-oxobutanoate hydroxymethyltransferase [Sumerlaeia bacterium]